MAKKSAKKSSKKSKKTALKRGQRGYRTISVEQYQAKHDALRDVLNAECPVSYSGRDVFGNPASRASRSKYLDVALANPGLSEAKLEALARAQNGGVPRQQTQATLRGYLRRGRSEYNVVVIFSVSDRSRAWFTAGTFNNFIEAAGYAVNELRSQGIGESESIEVN